MKTLKFTLLAMLTAVVFTSCSSVKVVSDYDKEANFTEYKTFAFYKPGIDKAEISDLDKKRILRAIENTMTKKGFVKSEKPDLLVNIFTKEHKEVDVYNNYGYGWGWSPWYWGGNFNTVQTSTQGSLYIDLIDAKNKELIWQGKGSGYLTERMEKKDERVNQFVTKILDEYPPEMK